MKRELYLAAQRNDTEGFLRHYLTLLEDNHSLSLPKAETLSNVIQEWKELLPVEWVTTLPDPFIKKLSKNWLSLVKGLSSDKPEEIVPELIAILSNKKVVQTPLKKVASHGTVSIHEGGDPTLSKVVSTVSDSYYDTTLETPRYEIEECRLMIQHYAETHKGHHVLSSYLAMAESGNFPLPKSSSPDKLHVFFKEALENTLTKEKLFNPIASTIVSDWVYLVQTYGFPSTEEDIHILRKNHDKRHNISLAIESRKEKKSFFSGLFNL